MDQMYFSLEAILLKSGGITLGGKVMPQVFNILAYKLELKTWLNKNNSCIS